MWTKEDRSFKILIGKQVTSKDKAHYEEYGAVTITVQFQNVWTSEVPENPADAVAAGVAQKYTLFELRPDTSVRNSECYYAYDTVGGKRLTDWISDVNGPAYPITLYDFNGVEITPTDDSGWFFDYPTGTLTFNGNANGKARPFKITGYRYVGEKGGDVSRIGYIGQRPVNDSAYFPAGANANRKIPVFDSGTDRYELEDFPQFSSSKIILKTKEFLTNGGASFTVDTDVAQINYVSIGGVLQTQGQHFTLSGRVLTFDPAPKSDLLVLVSYFEVMDTLIASAVDWESIYGDPADNPLLVQYVQSVISGTTRIVYENPIDGSTGIDLGTHQTANEIQCGSTNSSETITDILNIIEHYPIRFYPQPGLTITFLSGAENGNLRCEGNTEVTVIGNDGDWVEFTRRGSLVYQTNGANYGGDPVAVVEPTPPAPPVFPGGDEA